MKCIATSDARPLKRIFNSITPWPFIVPIENSFYEFSQLNLTILYKTKLSLKKATRELSTVFKFRTIPVGPYQMERCSSNVYIKYFLQHYFI